MQGVISSLNLALPIKDNLEPLHLFSLWYRIDHGQSWSVGPTGVFETEDAIVLHLLQQVHCLDEIVRGFPRKSNNDVSRKRDLSFRRLGPADALEIPVGCVFPRHHFEHT